METVGQIRSAQLISDPDGRSPLALVILWKVFKKARRVCVARRETRKSQLRSEKSARGKPRAEKCLSKVFEVSATVPLTSGRFNGCRSVSLCCFWLFRENEAPFPWPFRRVWRLRFFPPTTWKVSGYMFVVWNSKTSADSSLQICSMRETSNRRVVSTCDKKTLKVCALFNNTHFVDTINSVCYVFYRK